MGLARRSPVRGASRQRERLLYLGRIATIAGKQAMDHNLMTDVKLGPLEGLDASRIAREGGDRRWNQSLWVWGAAMHLRRMMKLSPLVLVAAAVGCGGKTSGADAGDARTSGDARFDSRRAEAGADAGKPHNGGDAGRADVSPDTGKLQEGGDAATDRSAPWGPVCPASAPAQGSACTHDELECEYGCNNVLTCADGTWGGAILPGGGALCDAGSNPATCPAALSAITSGAACANEGPTCVYAGGICQCSGPMDPWPDAGSTWYCGPEQGCPFPRPPIGSACSTPDQRCDYEQCGGNQVCQGGVWQPVAGACGG